MKKNIIRLLAMLLALGMLMCGCDQTPAEPQQNPTAPAPTDPVEVKNYTHWDDMTYTRPSAEPVQEAYDVLVTLADSDDFDTVVAAVADLDKAVNDFSTNYSLAQIYYYADQTVTEWEEEQNFCSTLSPTIEQILEDTFYMLAKSPCREQLEQTEYFTPDFFDEYDGENPYDDTWKAMKEEEADLENAYTALFGEAQEVCEPASEEFYDNYGDQLAQILVDLIAKRQQIAAYLDYPQYDQYAWDNHQRDYTPKQFEEYLLNVQEKLVPLYGNMDYNAIMVAYNYCSQKQMMSFLTDTVGLLGGSVQEAYDHMQEYGLFDLEHNDSKFDISFVTYLPSYDQPYLFVNPTRTRNDCLTLVHEFGHFANAYCSGGIEASTDVAEIFSQAMEFLSLCYVENDRGLTQYKIADSLMVFVEQSLYASFEMEAYKLTGDELNVENLYRLFSESLEKYGLGGIDPRLFTVVHHFYTAPMYIPSYIVSNDAAMQFYLLELEESGAGLTRYMENLDTQEIYFLSFLDSANLESPFDPAHMDAIAKVIEDAVILQEDEETEN